MKRAAIVVVLIGVLAVLAWLWRTPEPEARPERRRALTDAGPPPDTAAGERKPEPERPATARPAGRLRASVPPPPPAAETATVAPSGQATSPAPGGRATPGTAAVRLKGHPEQVRRLLAWAGRDREAATAWADGLSDPAARREALEAVCFKVAERDPRAAVDMAETFGLDDDPSVRENLAAQWAAVDAPAALEWALRMPPGDVQEGAVSRVIVALVASDPREAARLVEGELRPGRTQIEAAASLVQQWWLVDPAAARDWADGLEESPLRDRALRELAILSRRP